MDYILRITATQAVLLRLIELFSILSVVWLRLLSVALTEERDSLVRPYSTLVNSQENYQSSYNPFYDYFHHFYMSEMTNQNTTTNPNPQTAPVTLDDMFAAFGGQGDVLKGIFTAYSDNLHGTIATLEQKVKEQELELIATKRNGTFTLTQNDMQRMAISIAKATAPQPKNKIEAVMPEKFEGKPEQVDPFLSAIQLYFTLRPDTFQNDLQKILWILQLFTKEAGPWSRSKVKKITAGEVVYKSVTS